VEKLPLFQARWKSIKLNNCDILICTTGTHKVVSLSKINFKKRRLWASIEQCAQCTFSPYPVLSRAPQPARILGFSCGGSEQLIYQTKYYASLTQSSSFTKPNITHRSRAKPNITHGSRVKPIWLT
jgi:hypothetical protein